MLEWWQTLPVRLDPVAFSVGFFSVYWYALFLLLGIGAAYICILWLKRRGELSGAAGKAVDDIFFFTLVGAFIGGKVGYILFYAGEIFRENPAVFLPYDFGTGMWNGLTGMSYHGAVLGGMTALFLFTRKKKLPFFPALDLMALLAPLLSFFGRLGNFFTGELPGRLTEKSWGMFFPHTEPLFALRHPAVLYEAVGEGLLLFFLLFAFRKRLPPGGLVILYLLAYSTVRFCIEFFREPDPNRGLYFGIFTLGQILSVFFFLGTVALWRAAKKHDIL